MAGKKKITKGVYIGSIKERYSTLERKFKEVEKMRKNHKERINPNYTGRITSISNLTGRYKYGSRAGQLKVTDAALRKLTLKELRRLDRLMELQQGAEMYSARDKEIREEAWKTAYDSFKNASNYVNKENGIEVEKRRRNLTEEDYRNMVYLFEKMEGDLLHAYGSDVAEQLYEETEGLYDTSTLYDVMLEGIKVGHLAEEGVFGRDKRNKGNEVAQDFLWYWSGYMFDDPDTEDSIEDIVFEFILDETGNADLEKEDIIDMLKKYD